MKYEFITSDEARLITGHNSNGAFTIWARRYNMKNPDTPILRVGYRYDRYSIERAILRLNGVQS